MLLAACGAVLPQPRRQLRFLLRLQVYAVVDPLDGLFVSALRRCDFVCGEEIRYLVAQSGIAENAGCSHDLGAGERPTGLFDLGPVLADKIPSRLLTCGIPQDTRHEAEGILRTHIG